MALVPSAARTITLTGWITTGSVSVRPVALVWPAKQSRDVLDFSVNIAAWLADGGNDVPTSITVTPLTLVQGDVTILPPLQVTTQLITCILAYGQGGATYGFAFSIVTEQGRLLEFEVTIAVLSTTPNVPTPLDPPAPVYWPFPYPARNQMSAQLSTCALTLAATVGATDDAVLFTSFAGLMVLRVQGGSSVNDPNYTLNLYAGTVIGGALIYSATGISNVNFDDTATFFIPAFVDGTITAQAINIDATACVITVSMLAVEVITVPE